MPKREDSRSLHPEVWTLTVILIALFAGILLALIPRPDRPGPGPGPGAFQTFDDLVVILSTIGMALLAALLVVYAKTYADTRAWSALGLFFVLVALLFEAALSSPLLIGAFGHPLGGLGPFLLVSSAFRTVALAVFLYLSLQ